MLRKNFAQRFIFLVLLMCCMLLKQQIASGQLVQKFLKSTVKENPALTPYIEKSISFLRLRRFDSAMVITRQGLALAVKLKDSVAIGKMHYNLALNDRFKGHFPAANKNIAIAIDLLTRVGSSKYLANAMYLQNIIVADQGHREEAIARGLINLKFFEAIGETDDLTRTYGLLNSLFIDLKDPAREKMFRNEFLASIKKSKNQIFRAQGFSMIAMDYETRSDYKGAWPFWQQSLRSQQFDRSSPNHVLSLIAMSKNLRQRALYQQAVGYLDRARLVAESIGSNRLLGTVYVELSNLQLSLHHQKLALSLARKAMALARADLHKNDVLPTLQNLALIEEQSGQYQQALKSHAEISSRKDSLFNNERSKIIADAGAKYDLEKKENKISSLHQDVKLARAVTESGRIKLQASNQKNYFLFAVVVLLTLLVLAIAYFYYQSRKLQNQLTESNRLKDKMFSIISHDLRNPVGSLKASLTLLQNKKQSAENFERFEQQVDFLQYTMDNVLYWSLSQQKAIRAISHLVDLREIIDEVAGSLQGLIRIKNIDLTAEGSQAYMKIDEQLLVIVLRNILHNAIKFTPEGGHIKIGVTIKPSGTQILIRDSGPGLKTNENPDKKMKNQGTGLGLNLSEELMKKNGGELTITSQQNEGTTVILHWAA